MKNTLPLCLKSTAFILSMLLSVQGFSQQKSTLNGHELNAGISTRLYNLQDGSELTKPDILVLHAGYKYALSKRFMVGGTAGVYYHPNERPDNGLIGGCYGDYYRKWNVHKDYAFLLAHVQYNWVSTKVFKIYSGIEGGLKYRKTTSTEEGIYSEDYTRNFRNKADRNNIATACQLNLIGIRAGNKIAGFAELGLGDKGYATIGLSCRF